MWIELTDVYDKKIIFNIDDISTIRESDYKHSKCRLITMKNRNEYSVINEYSDIKESINNASLCGIYKF